MNKPEKQMRDMADKVDVLAGLAPRSSLTDEARARRDAATMLRATADMLEVIPLKHKAVAAAIAMTDLPKGWSLVANFENDPRMDLYRPDGTTNYSLHLDSAGKWVVLGWEDEGCFDHFEEALRWAMREER